MCKHVLKLKNIGNYHITCNILVKGIRVHFHPQVYKFKYWRPQDNKRVLDDSSKDRLWHFVITCSISRMGGELWYPTSMTHQRTGYDISHCPGGKYLAYENKSWPIFVKLQVPNFHNGWWVNIRTRGWTTKH